MKFQNQLFLSVLLLFMCWPGYAHAISAFPGAQGFGANSVGGRGGTVIKVTNLNDSGAGSFRAAVTATGKRIVVFETSGIINLSSTLTISNPYITIAGQTSPGGILITGRGVIINTHDVIIQHMRFRVGTNGIVYNRDGSNNIIYYNQQQYNFPPTGSPCLGNVTTEALGYPCAISGGADPETLDTLDIFGNSMLSWFPNAAYNIIIDHCSIGWGVDETVEIALGATDITVQWSIISEGLYKAGHPKGKHSKGLVVSGKYTNTDMKVSLHHNYFANNEDRNPMVSGANTGYTPNLVVDVVNNVVYNYYGAIAMTTYTTGKANWVHNYVKGGPESISNSFEATHFDEGYPMQPLIYVDGNIGSRRFTQSDAAWAVGYMWYDQLLDTGYRTMTPWPAPAIKKAVMSSSVANCVVSAVGATAPIRDSVDTKNLADFANGTGSYRNKVSYPADFPTFSTLASPSDSDNDGMADSWETANGMDTTKNDSASDKDKDGYTNIEEYLHYLSANSYTYNALCMPDVLPPAAPQSSVK